MNLKIKSQKTVPTTPKRKKYQSPSVIKHSETNSAELLQVEYKRWRTIEQLAQTTKLKNSSYEEYSIKDAELNWLNSGENPFAWLAIPEKEKEKQLAFRFYDEYFLKEKKLEIEVVKHNAIFVNMIIENHKEAKQGRLLWNALSEVLG